MSKAFLINSHRLETIIEKVVKYSSCKMPKAVFYHLERALLFEASHLISGSILIFLYVDGKLLAEWFDAFEELN